MELNFTTFILEIFNFLVLLWILKKLFLIPIRNAIETRKREIETALENVKETQKVADQQRHLYENRIQDWEKEKTAKIEELNRNLNQEREDRLKKIAVEENQKHEALEIQRSNQEKANYTKLESRAIRQSLEFASKLLRSFASEDLEAKLFQAALTKIKTETNFSRLLQNGNAADIDSILIRSAFPVTDAQRRETTKVFDGIMGKSITLQYDVNKELIAGVQLIIGPLVVEANLRDELKFFADLGDHHE